MQRIVLLLLSVVVCCGLLTPALAQEHHLKVENDLLRAEYELARKGQIYLYLDFSGKKAEIRSSGIAVATIPIEEIRSWGPYPVAGLHVIAEKDRVPAREKIQIPPPEGEVSPPKPVPPPAPADPAAAPVVKKFEVQATEVTDMPSEYSMELEGGGLVTVRSNLPGPGWKEQWRHRFERPLWRLSRAYTSIINHRQQKPYTELLLIMTPLDAQRLYWALPLGSALLIPEPEPR